jgi:hypothetical protein
MKCTTRILQPRPVFIWPPKAPLPELPPCVWSERAEFPMMISQWHWGVMCYWDTENQCFITQEKLSGDNDLANTAGPLMQLRIDGFDIDLNRPDLGWGFLWAKSSNNNRNEIFRQMIENDPADDLNFWLHDLALEGTDAAGRSYFVVNSPDQPRLKRCQVCQVTDTAGYNTYFDQWKTSGFAGCVAQQMNAAFSDNHHLCDFYMG